MSTDMKKSTTPPLLLIAKIAVAMTFINAWVIFEETIVDRHGLWRYMPYYRVGLFCVWDAAVLVITLLLLLVNVRASPRRDGKTQSTTPPLPLIRRDRDRHDLYYYAGHSFRLAWCAVASLHLISLANGNLLFENWSLEFPWNCGAWDLEF